MKTNPPYSIKHEIKTRLACGYATLDDDLVI